MMSLTLQAMRKQLAKSTLQSNTASAGTPTSKHNDTTRPVPRWQTDSDRQKAGRAPRTQWSSLGHRVLQTRHLAPWQRCAHRRSFPTDQIPPGDFDSFTTQFGACCPSQPTAHVRGIGLLADATHRPSKYVLSKLLAKRRPANATRLAGARAW